MFLFCIDTEMHRLSRFYRKRITTNIMMCMFVHRGP